MIKADSITAIYCWDAAVHFDKSVMRDYIKEFSRVLKAGGRGFIHYSSLGQSAKSDIRKNPHWRSNMDKDLFGQYCEEYGLQVIKQFNLAWREIPDC
ncbi:MAG: methyltransferase type 11, partial [Candidatus Aminicenantes bacterium]|nr:methyltransferase type 11 [Candidatus Aminicenantes bacterium]NIN23020.1 methyltransferase type 11 [Candidatus Aminicenantes bacterium]NIN46756.1 methyltransferase type 11 [Candidatus Aminicenantes bacterium]NIN89669.1 methyltransferase type 11 [Candidatus Aminicenantes bacterium]NIR10613.1 methyltransferase type 11 [Candidatus Aminicenantes bacterium]